MQVSLYLDLTSTSNGLGLGTYNHLCKNVKKFVVVFFVVVVVGGGAFFFFFFFFFFLFWKINMG